MKQASFMPLFEGDGQKIKEHVTIPGGWVLAQELPAEEFTTESGLVIVESKSVDGWAYDKALAVQVLLTGEGYYNDDDEAEALPVEAGAVLLVPAHSIRACPTFHGLVGTQQGSRLFWIDVNARFASYPTFDAYAAAGDVVATRKEVLTNAAE